MRLSRRALLAGAASGIASSLLAEAPLTSIRPVARVSAKVPVADVVARAQLSGTVGLAVMDLNTGAFVEQIAADLLLPPASVTKAFTAIYALDALGPDYRFETRLFADGPIQNGILDGHLILAGGGDPNLVTDELAALAQALKETGLREVKGDFLVWDNALVNLDEIDADQQDYLGYNPTITGLNLNYNRVHFEWKRQGEGFVTTMDARSENYRPAVTSSQISIVDRASPLFTYRDAGEVDQWTVAREALNDAGSRWLPVRHPAVYAGEVFAVFARSHGIVLKPPKEHPASPSGTVLATHQSQPMTEILRGMLRFSTNITAEAAGLSATAALSGQMRGLRTSAIGMARWAATRAPGIAPHFVDHSGLGDQSRVSARDMVRLLAADGVPDQLAPILRQIPLAEENLTPAIASQVTVRAKTGTLNFVSSLAGYMQGATGGGYAFAIFAADPDARAQGKLTQDEQPPGARSWNTRARAMQQEILAQMARDLV